MVLTKNLNCRDEVFPLKSTNDTICGRGDPALQKDHLPI
jgi:hypothetical protein